MGRNSVTKKKKNPTKTEIFTPAADIVFIVRDHPHPMFTRIETDLIYRPDIPLVTVGVR